MGRKDGSWYRILLAINPALSYCSPRLLYEKNKVIARNGDAKICKYTCTFCTCHIIDNVLIMVDACSHNLKCSRKFQLI